MNCDSLPRLIQEIVVMSDARNTSQDLLSFAPWPSKPLRASW